MVTIAEIKKKAKKMNIQPGNMSKIELIRAIQSSEGNFPCFKTPAHGTCDQLACCWREDCLATR